MEINTTNRTPSSSVINLLGPAPNKRVLFVDDEDLVLRAFARDLSRSDIEVVVVRSAAKALSLLEKDRFSVILSDFQMPEMNGIELLERARSVDPDAVRILVSGRADFDTAIAVINRVGLFNFIGKPWDPYDLRDILRRALEHHAITVENRRLGGALSTKCSQLSELASNLEVEVRNRTTSLLLGLVNALDLRDTETQWHSRRVAVYSKRLAEQMGIAGDELQAVLHGALLHDIGKIGVSDTILLKPGKLTPEEWEEMKRHAEYGYRILERIDFLKDARLLVLQHHERWDGRGYPGGLLGTATYVGARIFAVIDTYDAMTSDRPYRKALPHEVACAEITKMSGTQFDPDIVDAWQQITKDELFALKDSVGEPQGFEK